jgi:predicted nucleotidyltransferase
MPWLPESPRWLLTEEKSDRAWEIVRMLHSRGGDDHSFAAVEFYQIKKQHELEIELESSWL